MGIVKYSPGIEFVKGSLAKPKKQDGHNHGDYLVGTHREAPTTNPNCTRLYVRKGDAYERHTALSENETWARTRFSEVAAAIKTRKRNLTQLTTDQAAFLAQKDQPGGIKTMQAYYWSICGAEWDTQNPRG